MTENEEKIWIEYAIPKPKGAIKAPRRITITRQEAIECMARAMFEWQRPGSRGDVPIEDVWQYEKCGFENLAEAALDALLSL